MPLIDPTARVASGAVIGDDVAIGPRFPEPDAAFGINVSGKKGESA